jgi:hypothetical protein
MIVTLMYHCYDQLSIPVNLAVLRVRIVFGSETNSLYMAYVYVI